MSNNVISIKKRFLGQLPTVFNPSDFVSRDIEAENIIADNIVSSNIKNLEQVVSTSIALNSDGLPADVATKTYVNSSISTLQNTLLGTNIPSQLNQNLDTILEIDNFITDLKNTVDAKANQTDLNTTNANVLTNTNNITTNTNNIATNTSNITTLQTSKANQSDLNSTNTRVSTLESKTNVISYNPTTNTTIINSKLQVNLDQGNTGSTYLGDDSSDSFVVRATSNFIGPVVGLTKSTVGLSNIDNTSDINKPLSTAQKTYIDNGLSLKANQTDLNTTNTNVTTNTTSIASLQTSKADKSLVLYSNSWYVNSGQNLISSVLNSIGNSQNQTIYLSSGGINEVSGLNIVDKVNLTFVAPFCSYSSPATVVYGDVSISGSNTLRIRFSSVGFNDNVSIDGTQGKHSFTGCVFSKNFTLLNAGTNFIQFIRCSFAGQINVPSSYAGVIYFDTCDFNGSTLNFNNLSNQQIYIASAFNLPSFNVNALLNGQVATTSATAVYTTSLFCSGSVIFPDNSIPISTINNLQSSLNAKQNLLLFDSTPTTNSTNIVDSGNIKTYVDTSISNLVNSAPSTLDTLNELANALGNDANFSTTITNLIGTKANQSDLNTTNTNVLNNTNSITTLQSSKQDTLSYDTVPTQNSTKLLTSSSLYNTFSNYVTSSGLGSTLASYVLSSSLTTTLSSYLTISSASSTYQTIAGMSSYLTTSLASSTYQTISGMSNYASLSGNNTLTGNNVITTDKMYEQIHNAGSGTNLSLTYTSIKGVVYYSPAANFLLTLSSIPTSSTNASYSITFIYNTKFYCSAISVNGSSYTMKAGAGLANISINSSATHVFQQINILFLNSSTPTITTNVISLF